MMTQKDIDEKIRVRDSHRKWQRECGLTLCKRCGGTKHRTVSYVEKIFDGVAYTHCNVERCYFCNDDGMVDPWSELMGKKWHEYVHKMY